MPTKCYNVLSDKQLLIFVKSQQWLHCYRKSIFCIKARKKENNMEDNFQSIDFLKPTINSIRKSIRGIEDSYNNYWDILAELIQNSVDAIYKRNFNDGKIEIIIDEANKSITVNDNGIGMKYEEVPSLLLPFSTNKENDFETIGEKGVGLKFVLFQSEKFELKTRSVDENDGSYSLIEGASTWKKKTDETNLPLKIATLENFDVGTSIKVDGISNNDEIFSMNIISLAFLLRTKTAVGNVDNLFSNYKNIKITLKVIDPSGQAYEKNVPFKYWVPTECLKNNEKISLDDYQAWLAEKDRDNIQKSNKLKDKVVYKSGRFMHNDVREIKYWLCYVPKRKFWNDLSIRDGLITETEANDEDVFTKKHMCLHQPILTAAVKGMPTGIVINNPKAGKDGYWQNMFIIFEDKQLRFDIGRKAINSSIVTMYQKYLKQLFNNVTGLVSKYVSGDIDDAPNYQWDRDEIVKNITSLPALDDPNVNFEKLPNEQEASVCAIFYELIGSKTIKSIKPILSGYKSKYDLYAKFNGHFITVEFKTHLRNIIKDFDDFVKLFNEMDYIVCWDLNDDDISALNDVDISITTINGCNDGTFAPETTHKLQLTNVKPIYVIDLKELLRRERERNDE